MGYKSRGVRIALAQNAIALPIHCAIAQPLQRGIEKQWCVDLPHGVMGGTAQVEQHLLAGTEILVHFVDAGGWHLHVVNARYQQHRRFGGGDDLAGPAPDRRVRCTPYAGAPGSANRIGGEHVLPHGRSDMGFDLIGAGDLTVPAIIEVELRLLGECGTRHRHCLRRGSAVAAVGRGQQHQTPDLVGIKRRITCRARPAKGPSHQMHGVDAAHFAQIIDHGVDVVPIRLNRRGSERETRRTGR